jgi:hypothetical protein
MKPVTVYVVQQEPYRQWVTAYDHCGKPYKRVVIRYRTVRVPVIKYVKIRY